MHEIFTNHEPKLKNKYYDYFKVKNHFTEILDNIEPNDEFIIPLKHFNVEKKTAFDIKQLICHLLGIGANKNNKKQKLVYLFFKPECDDERVNDKFEDLKIEINTIFNSEVIRNICKHMI